MMIALRSLTSTGKRRQDVGSEAHLAFPVLCSEVFAQSLFVVLVWHVTR
jgi:hypothetical protein